LSWGEKPKLRETIINLADIIESIGGFIENMAKLEKIESEFSNLDLREYLDAGFSYFDMYKFFSLKKTKEK